MMTPADRSKWLEWKPGDQIIFPHPPETTAKTAKTSAEDQTRDQNASLPPLIGTDKTAKTDKTQKAAKLDATVQSAGSDSFGCFGSSDQGVDQNILAPERGSAGEGFDLLDAVRQLVSYVALQEDVTAHNQFQLGLPPEPPPVPVIKTVLDAGPDPFSGAEMVHAFTEWIAACTQVISGQSSLTEKLYRNFRSWAEGSIMLPSRVEFHRLLVGSGYRLRMVCNEVAVDGLGLQPSEEAARPAADISILALPPEPKPAPPEQTSFWPNGKEGK